MKAMFAVFLLAAVHGLAAQTTITATGKSTTAGPCSPSSSGQGNTFIIMVKNCGIGKQQGDKIIELLKSVLANEDSRDAKLDQILEIVKSSSANPYATVITYLPNGEQRIVTQSTGKVSLDRGARDVLEEMNKEGVNGSWQRLSELASKAISDYPGWFTPIALLGEAQTHQCKEQEAIESFRKFLSDTDGIEAYKEIRPIYQNLLDNIGGPYYLKMCPVSK